MSKPYDSLSNFLGENAIKYVGQTLYLKELIQGIRDSGYENFYTTNNSRVFRDDIYKCCSKNYNRNSNYDSIVRKYFEVLEVSVNEKDSQYKNSDNTQYYLKLKEKSSEDIIYYNYDSKYSVTFPFVVVGYIEKLKRISIGKKFVFGKCIYGSYDVNTGKPINIIQGEKWECIDVTIGEPRYLPSLLLKDKTGQTILMESEFIYGDEKFHNIFTSIEADKYKTKFGNENWKKILQGKVWIGMTKEMCKLSWGFPNKINSTITNKRKSEQWIYDDNYLYFTNGILTAIQ